jgi:uncharacterized alkaline shock family protein YloU
MSAFNKAAELARAIVESNECKRVLSLKHVIDRNTEYKNKIKSLKAVQENVKRAIESMTGLEVVEVNVHIQGVEFKTDEPESKLL